MFFYGISFNMIGKIFCDVLFRYDKIPLQIIGISSCKTIEKYSVFGSYSFSVKI